MANELRQGLNKVEIVGVVKENKLQEGTGEKGDKYINGSLIIKAGDFTEIELKVFVNEKNKEGKEKKAYATLKSILNKEYKSMADGATEEEAAKIRVWSGNDSFTAQFREERFMTDGSPEPVTKISIDLGFSNIKIDESITPQDYKATFDVEIYVSDIAPEIKNDEETGRYLIKGWCPVYGGLAIPLTFVAGMVQDEEGEFDFGEQINQGVDIGSTLDIWGNIDYKSIITKVKKDGGLGRAKIEDKRTYIHDLTAIGAMCIDDNDKEFDEELIKTAIKERQIKLDEIKAQGTNNKKQTKGLTGANNSDKPRRSMPRF